jgi:outer membrane protein assembly factor BamB
MLCLDEADGSLQWQLVVPRTPGDDIYLDWPRMCICSPPTVERDRVYTMTNQFELVCLDLDGQADGNQGPFQEEGRHMTPADEPPHDITEIDADILWMLDLPDDVGTYPHDSAHTSILLDGDYLFLNTCNGVDNTHRMIRRPDAPSLIVVDKASGHLVAQDQERIGPRIFHSTWSSPAMGTVNGRKLVFFCGGDGVCYAFAVPAEGSTGGDAVARLERVWRFDCDPASPKENVHQYHRNRSVSPSNVKSMPVFHNQRLYVTVGGDIWWGKNEAWLKCIDATQTGDVTDTAEIWSYPLERHVCSTPSIVDGLVFVADYSGNLHCVDAETGTAYWTHDLGGRCFASTLVADGKVYIGTMLGNFWILSAQREKRVLHQTKFDAPIAATVTAANNVLYVNTLETLYAIHAGTQTRRTDVAVPSVVGD